MNLSMDDDLQVTLRMLQKKYPDCIFMLCAGSADPKQPEDMIIQTYTNLFGNEPSLEFLDYVRETLTDPDLDEHVSPPS